MSYTAIRVENVSKQYRLGVVGTGTLSHDLNRWWHSVRGKDDPFLKVGQENDRAVKGGSDLVWALKDVAFEVKQGDRLGIIGKNGAGKSTLLKILSRITFPSTGSIKIKGRIAALLEVGTGFHAELTGRENIYLNGAILGMTRVEIKSKLDEIIDFSGVAKYVDTPVKRYSSGMLVRLGFAVAAHLEPEILVVDEVLAVGDAEFQKKCLGKMKDVSTNDGRTILFVSHNMLAVKSLCNIGLLIDKGKTKEVGRIETIVDSYLSINDKSISSFVSIEQESGGLVLHSIKVSNNGTGGSFDIEEDLVFDIKVSSQRDYQSISVNIFFNTVEGATIFATCSPAEEFVSGEYFFRCIIPANTLNDNTYSIGLMVVEYGPKVLHNITEVITIKGCEEKREGAWLGKFPGVIRPQYFKWDRIKE
jgi:lipopolysaccharide transport system ATP-binding protein